MHFGVLVGGLLRGCSRHRRVADDRRRWLFDRRCHPGGRLLCQGGAAEGELRQGNRHRRRAARRRSATCVQIDPARTATVVRATLQLLTSSKSTAGFTVHRVASTTWGETTITYANAPPIGDRIGRSSGANRADTYVSVDVTPLVTRSGLVSLAVKPHGPGDSASGHANTVQAGRGSSSRQRSPRPPAGARAPAAGTAGRAEPLPRRRRASTR